MRNYAQVYLNELQGMLKKIDPLAVERVTDMILEAYDNERRVFIIGNGGSASAASHMACDLSKNTVTEGKPRLKVISLTDNMALFSAIANDCGYENVFIEQIKNIFHKGDLLIGISASGNSPNVVKAMEWVNENGGNTIAIVGFTGGKMKECATISIFLDHTDYGPVEDGHLIINHMITGFLQKKFAEK
ncbi:MAG: SIS domain-containing protein [Candidatus Woesearchaeota archaeon]|nr:SIS domain-containing protein [Candidatus Woesearchaeota archaeon]